MRIKPIFSFHQKVVLLLGLACALTAGQAQTNIGFRILAANLNGSAQSYQPFALRILQGTRADVVAIQEFNYSNNTAAAFRSMVDTCFGTDFVYYREPYTNSGDIPNGVISRYPILSSGSWSDTQMASPNRGFAWAQIGLPGTNSLYVVSVHLLTSSAAARAGEATALAALIQTNFPANAWVVIAGDFNTDSRTESAMTIFGGFLSDYPVPVDNNGNSNTSQNRNHPHDYVLPSFNFTNFETATTFPSHSFPSGLVFDSTVYTPLSEVSPVEYGDSTNAQHMAVMKDFSIFTTLNNVSNAPAITSQPQSQTNFVGAAVSLSVSAAGSYPLSYQWYFNGAEVPSAASNLLPLASLQLTNAGNYFAIVTNNYGAATSSVVVLGVTNAAPFITAQPQSQTNYAGQPATFNVAAGGSPLLSFLWLFNNSNIPGATNTSFSIAGAQTTNAGNYSVVVANSFGSVTSAVAALVVNPPITGTPVILAGWDTSALSNYGPSPFAPTTNAPNLAIVGLTRGGGVTTLNAAGARTWGGNGFNAASESAAIAANEFATFSITPNPGFTVSFTSLVKYDYKRSSAGPPNGVLQYQIGAGAFTDVANYSYTSTTGASLGPVDLSGISALRSVPANTTVTFRIVNYGASSSGGNWYIFDLGADTAPDLAVQGIINFTAPATNAPAVISAPVFSGNQLRFSVTGTTGSNYVVQFSTNLTTESWTSIFTNPAPFDFTETNLSTPQKFYRVISPP